MELGLAARMGPGDGNSPPIYLVWAIEVSGTFCGKNIFLQLTLIVSTILVD